MLSGVAGAQAWRPQGPHCRDARLVPPLNVSPGKWEQLKNATPPGRAQEEPPQSSPGRCQTPPPIPIRCFISTGDSEALPAVPPGRTSPARSRREPRARLRSTQQPAPTPRPRLCWPDQRGGFPTCPPQPSQRNKVLSTGHGAGGRGTRPRGGLWRDRRRGQVRERGCGAGARGGNTAGTRR